MRGTTRDRAKLSEIEAAGAEGVVADPDRLGTVMHGLTGVAVVCWLMGDARDAPELHGHRLRTLMERLVDTPVRGLVYEAAGAAGPEPLAEGAATVRAASETWRIRVEVVDAPPDARDDWLAAMTAAVGRLLAA